MSFLSSILCRGDGFIDDLSFEMSPPDLNFASPIIHSMPFHKIDEDLKLLVGQNVGHREETSALAYGSGHTYDNEAVSDMIAETGTSDGPGVRAVVTNTLIDARTARSPPGSEPELHDIFKCPQMCMTQQLKHGN
ncbi:MAG: hypothetical protein M1837_002293 [Sclerophora amabilis]|nr:MAG: hypothetical protein M1837_002293 [Sclerophora amabilis]